jgi:ribosomal protein S27E
MSEERSPKSPYREAAPIVALVPGPPPLWPFRAWNAEKRLITMPKAGEPVDPRGRTSDVHCPGCAVNWLLVAGPQICAGIVRRRWFFWRTVICAEWREHFHVKCSECGWATLMETHAAYEAREP